MPLRVVIGGLLASTLVTLILIPVAYSTATGLTARIKSSRWMSSAPDGEDRATA